MAVKSKKKLIARIIGVIISIPIIFIAAILIYFEFNVYGGASALIGSMVFDKYYADKYSALRSEVQEPFSMSQKDMEKDFEYMYNAIVKNAGSVNCFDEAYGYSFADRHDMYLEYVRECQNEAEFYGVMTAILKDFPSCHTDTVTPTLSSVLASVNGSILGKYEILNDNETISRNAYLGTLIYEAKKDISDPIYTASYYNGEYVFFKDGQIEGILESIDGISMNQYVTQNLMGSYPCYDSAYKCPYRLSIKFYDKPQTTFSEEVTAAVTSIDGKSGEKKVYLDFCADIILRADIPEEKPQEDQPQEENEQAEPETSETPSLCYTYYDEKEDIGYVRLNQIIVPEGETVDKEFAEIADCDNIILDLRSCPGGNSYFAKTEIYKFFYENDYKEPFAPAKPLSFANCGLRNSHSLKDIFKDLSNVSTGEDGRKYTYVASDWSYIGNGSHSKNVVVLIDCSTASAADGLAAAAKDNGSIVIGNSTLGEGRSGSGGFYVDKCPVSNLCFQYNPFIEYNSDGSCNNVYGTIPTIFFSNGIEELQKKYALPDDIDPNSYEGMMLWDKMFLKAYETMKESIQ